MQPLRIARIGTTFSAVVALTAGLTAAAPQARTAAHPLVGTWIIEYERGRRVTDAGVETIMGKATLEIAAKGDSLVGTLLNERIPNGPATQPIAIAGTGSGANATLRLSTQARATVEDEERTINISMTWVLKAEGDNLTGTMSRGITDMPEMEAPSPVKGSRVK